MKKLSAKFKYLVPVFIGGTLFFSWPSAYADQSSARFSLPYVGGSLGFAEVDNDNFDNSVAMNGFGGFYLFDNVSIEASTGYLGEFGLTVIVVCFAPNLRKIRPQKQAR